MGLFKKKKLETDFDYKSINEFAFTGTRVNRLLEVLITIAIVWICIVLLQKLKVLPIIIDFLKVISPLFIGIVIAWILCPFADKLDKKMPRILACIITYILFVGIITLILVFTVPSLVNQLKTFGTRVPSMVTEAKEIITNTSNKLGLNKTSIFNQINKNIFQMLENIDTTKATNVIIGGATSVVSVFATIILSLMVGFYFLLDYHKISPKVYKLIPNKHKKDARELVKRINQSLRGYIQGVLLVMLIVFISQTIGLTLAGHDVPMLFALICAVTDIIPFFGPWIGGIPAVVVGFLISPLTGVFTLVSILVVQGLENNVYQPIIMGHAMKLHPVTIIAALLIFGHFFGVIGMIIATPVVATLKLLFEFIDEKINLMDKIENA
ncbi:MAG: AI-2E family transporter [Bacilli bacterium]|nr:AI-2E family transporter [Bacilli bacterium]